MTDNMIHCPMCDEPTEKLTIKYCPRCWEMYRLIKARPDLARLILDYLERVKITLTSHQRAMLVTLRDYKHWHNKHSKWRYRTFKLTERLLNELAALELIKVTQDKDGTAYIYTTAAEKLLFP